MKVTKNTPSRVLITFGGVNSFFCLWVNDQKVGLGKDSRTPDEFDLTKHPYQLPQREVTVLNLDSKQQGLGGEDSWGAWSHEPYLIPCQPQSYSFRLHRSPQTRTSPPQRGQLLPKNQPSLNNTSYANTPRIR